MHCVYEALTLPKNRIEDELKEMFVPSHKMLDYENLTDVNVMHPFHERDINSFAETNTLQNPCTHWTIRKTQARAKETTKVS